MKILFQGDSITDAGRNYSDYHNMGSGYPKYAASLIASRHPDTDFEFINLGVSGDQTSDLQKRWKEDCTDLSPDFVSILIGVNDTWHRANERNWKTSEEYEESYRYILTETKKKTNAKIMILEQFLLPYADKDFFRIDLDPKIQITRKLAREFADVFVPLDGIFASHCIGVNPTSWADDGVHPTDAGASLIAEYYADAFDSIFKSI